MKYIKQYEILYSETQFKIGDYVRTNDIYNIEHDKPTTIWHNQYGIIKNVGYRTKTHELYLVHYDYDINDELKDFILRKSLTTKDYEFYQLETNYKEKKFDEWFCDEYIIKITKEEHDNAVLEIEANKSANKFNL